MKLNLIINKNKAGEKVKDSLEAREAT